MARHEKSAGGPSVPDCPPVLRLLAGVIARGTVRHPLLVGLVLVVLTVVSMGVLLLRTNFDPDILNLLPQDLAAVEGLRVYQDSFAQNRELAFALTWESVPNDAGDYRQQFADALAEQPWVLRLMGEDLAENPEAPKFVQEFALPLLLNLPPDALKQKIAEWQSPELEARIARLADEAKKGSFRARLELESDPLGLVGTSMAPLWEKMSPEQSLNLVSSDETTILVPVITRQQDLSPEASHQLMQDVRAFIAQQQAQMGPHGPRIMVTGRAAYVDEISSSMNRDLTLTSLMSLIGVTAIFWLGFRRVIPLIGIALLLSLSALVATAGGAVVFHQLNVIAIGFCSILFGLGDDFSLLICQRFYREQALGRSREQAIAIAIGNNAAAILWVALTTGIGFLALCFSGSKGFGQLGALVAGGVAICAILMLGGLPLFLGGKKQASSAKTGPAGSFALLSVKAPWKPLGLAALLFIGTAIVALIPWRALKFDLSPASLEPKDIPAAQALNLMREKFPESFEPLLLVLKDPTPERVQVVDQTLLALREEGLLDQVSLPSPLILREGNLRENQRQLQAADLPQILRRTEDAFRQNGLNPAGLAPQGALLQKLQAPGAEGDMTWAQLLPEESPWWFLLDRVLSPDGQVIAASLEPKAGITADERLALESRITKALPEAYLTGWSQMIVSLVPWAHRELALFGSAVLGLITVTLLLVYRNVRLWLIHLLSLAAAAGAIAATLKVLNTPINLLNVLAFPLILGVGVDYGTHLILAAREGNKTLAGTVKAVGLSGMTTITGFGALLFSSNPALYGLGLICSVGVAWCLVSSLLLVVPLTAIRRTRGRG